MARAEARIQVSIWSPESEFCELTPDAQWTYFLILGQSDLSLCGVAPLTLGRWARKAKGISPEWLRERIEVLAAERYVVVDWVNEEVWVRTFVKWDGILKGPNQFTGMSRDFAGIQSAAIRAAFIEELPGWLPPFLRGETVNGTAPKGIESMVLDRLHKGFVDAVLNPSPTPLVTPLVKGSETPTQPPDARVSHAPSTASASSTASSTMGHPDHSNRSGSGDCGVAQPAAGALSDSGSITTLQPFEAEFNDAWEPYPRKVKRLAALRAYSAIRRKGADPAELLAAVKHYAQMVHGKNTPPDRMLHGSTFFGPDEPWVDYVSGMPPGDSPLPAAAAGGAMPTSVHPQRTW